MKARGEARCSAKAKSVCVFVFGAFPSVVTRAFPKIIRSTALEHVSMIDILASSLPKQRLQDSVGSHTVLLLLLLKLNAEASMFSILGFVFI